MNKFKHKHNREPFSYDTYVQPVIQKINWGFNSPVPDGVSKYQYQELTANYTNDFRVYLEDHDELIEISLPLRYEDYSQAENFIQEYLDEYYPTENWSLQ